MLPARRLAESLTEHAEKVAKEEMSTMHKDFELLNDILVICLTVLGFIIAIAFRDLWWGPIYKRTFGHLRLPACSDLWIGKLYYCLCPCFKPAGLHDHFRMRILCQSATNLRETGGFIDKLRMQKMSASWEVKCGHNPKKTTSAQKVSSGKGSFTEWNEFIDLDLRPSDSSIEIRLLNLGDDYELIGSMNLAVSDFFDRATQRRLRVDKIVRIDDQDHKIKYKNTLAGNLTMSFILKPAGFVFEDGLNEALLTS